MTVAVLNTKRELAIRNAGIVRLAAVDWSMNLQADVKILASEELGLVWRKNTAKRRATTETLVVLGRSSGEETSTQ